MKISHMPPALSWSEFDCWNRDRSLWYERYVLGIQEKPTFAMRRGSYIHDLVRGIKTLEDGKNVYAVDEQRVHKKILDSTERFRTGGWEWEKKISVDVFDVPTVGYWDGKNENTLLEIKTGYRRWSEQKAREHGQMLFYAAQALCDACPIKTFVLLTISSSNGAMFEYQIEYGNAQIQRIISNIIGVKNDMVHDGVWDKRVGSRQRFEI